MWPFGTQRPSRVRPPRPPLSLPPPAIPVTRRVSPQDRSGAAHDGRRWRASTLERQARRTTRLAHTRLHGFRSTRRWSTARAHPVDGHLTVVIGLCSSASVDRSSWHVGPGDHHRGVHRREGSRLRRRLSGAVHLRVRPGEERVVLRGGGRQRHRREHAHAACGCHRRVRRQHPLCEPRTRATTTRSSSNTAETLSRIEPPSS